MKKLTLACLLALCLLFTAVSASFAEDATAPADNSPVTAAELAAWAADIKARALESTPENDPTAEEADVESGIMYL